MKVLFIGGTGNISTSVSRLCIKQDTELFLLNRGTRTRDLPGATVLRGDMTKPDTITAMLAGHRWDALMDRLIRAYEKNYRPSREASSTHSPEGGVIVINRIRKKAASSSLAAF